MHAEPLFGCFAIVRGGGREGGFSYQPVVDRGLRGGHIVFQIRVHHGSLEPSTLLSCIIERGRKRNDLVVYCVGVNLERRFFVVVHQATLHCGAPGVNRVQPFQLT
jgi:hypothetical protein